MTRIACSTKRSEWERRWGHELPRNWKGRIRVDGDELEDRLSFACLCAGIAAAFIVLCAIVFAL